MKKFYLLVIVFLTAGYGKVTGQQIVQNDKKARRILKEVSRRFKKLNSLEAKFNFTLINAQSHLNETQPGAIVMQPQLGKYRIKLPAQELFSDGKSTYTWLKGQKEIQISATDSSVQSFNPSRIFSIYERGFRYQYREDVMEGGKKLDVIDLIPVVEKKIIKAQIYIVKRARTVYKIKVFEKGGNEFIYGVTSYTANASVKLSDFTFDKKNYPGVEVVDLR